MSDNPFAHDYVAPNPAPVEDRPEPAEKVGKGSLITEPGFHPHITPAEYFAEPCPDAALTNSGIKILMGKKFRGDQALAKFAHWHPRLNPDAGTGKDSAALRFGSVMHRLALGKGAEYAISPYDDYRSADARRWKKEVEAAGQIPIKQAEFDHAKALADILRAQIEHLFDGHEFQTEVVLAWQEETEFGKVWCRTMLDVWCPDLLQGLDLKSTIDASDDALDRSYADGYAVQEYWQKRGIQRVTGEYGRVRVPFLFIEKTEPILTRVAEASEAYMSGAELICERALHVFGEHMSTGDWPGYEPYTAIPTPWFLNDAATLEMETA